MLILKNALFGNFFTFKGDDPWWFNIFKRAQASKLNSKLTLLNTKNC